MKEINLIEVGNIKEQLNTTYHILFKIDLIIVRCYSKKIA